jgi:hypothetical protein
LGRLIVATTAGTIAPMISTFAGQRMARATYADIMGCENGCEVAASGWPFVFVHDYPGMSVVNKANISEVWFAADKFDCAPFLLNVLVWSLLCFAVTAFLPRSRARY